MSILSVVLVVTAFNVYKSIPTFSFKTFIVLRIATSLYVSSPTYNILYLCAPAVGVKFIMYSPFTIFPVFTTTPVVVSFTTITPLLSGFLDESLMSILSVVFTVLAFNVYKSILIFSFLIFNDFIIVDALYLLSPRYFMVYFWIPASGFRFIIYVPFTRLPLLTRLSSTSYTSISPFVIVFLFESCTPTLTVVFVVMELSVYISIPVGSFAASIVVVLVEGIYKFSFPSYTTVISCFPVGKLRFVVALPSTKSIVDNKFSFS